MARGATLARGGWPRISLPHRELGCFVSLRLSLHKPPFQSGLFFYTGRQRGGWGGNLSLSFFFFFLFFVFFKTFHGATLVQPPASPELELASAVGALCPRKPGSGDSQRCRLQGAEHEPSPRGCKASPVVGCSPSRLSWRCFYLHVLPPRDNWHRHRCASLPVLPSGEDADAPGWEASWKGCSSTLVGGGGRGGGLHPCRDEQVPHALDNWKPAWSRSSP